MRTTTLPTVLRVMDLLVPNRAIIDTGPLLAAVNPRDNLHDQWADWFSTFVGERILPYAVLVEVCWSLEQRPDIEAALLASVARGEFTLEYPTKGDLYRMAELVTKYGDLPLGMVDASVVATAERLRIADIATIDNHFRIVRPKHVNAFTIVP